MAVNILLKSLLRKLWRYRHGALRCTRAGGAWMVASLGRLPLSAPMKEALRDGCLLAVDQLVVKTKAYQDWQRRGGVSSRVQWLIGRAQEQVHMPISAPTKEQWDALLLAKKTPDAQGQCVNVIIPVYRGYEETLSAIYHAVASKPLNKTPYQVIVINDDSPDDALVTSLVALNRAGHFMLVHNSENIGFVRSVNKGMRLDDARDVVLLNADTQTYHNWLDRLVAAAAAHEEAQVASVTPLSNNADMCSYPHFLGDNGALADMEWDALDALCAQANAGQAVRTPTAVGFCMYIRRHALNEVGYFDEERFGKGYGEENDFCMRAAKAGFVHLIASDVLVRHVGGASFGASRQRRIARAYDKVSARYPDYPALVKRFIADDPLLQHRRRLDVARLKKRLFAKNFLMVGHALGGGTQRHIDEVSHALAEERIGAVTLQPVTGLHGTIGLHHRELGALPNLTFAIDHDFEALIEVLAELSVKHMHIHHLVGYPAHMMEFLARVCEHLKMRYDVTVHDYYTICPRINLLGDNNRYCGEPEIADCERCIAGSYSHAGGQAVWLWRRRHATLLQQARRVYVPDADVAQRLSTYMDDLPIHVMPHAETFHGYRPVNVEKLADEPLRVAVIGAITTHAKGMEVLARAVEDAKARALAVNYVLIGYSDHPALAREHPHLSVSGAYDEADMAALLERYRPHVVFIPSIWPETYSYTLSIALKYGVKVVVFDIGAQARRVRALGTSTAGEVLPLTLAEDAGALNDWFCAYEGGVAQRLPDDVEYRYLTDYYAM